MNWLRKNWGWMVIIIVALLPLAGILKMIHLDFSGTAANWISMDSFSAHGRGHGHFEEVVPGAHFAVKVTGEWAIRWLIVVLSLTPFGILTGIKPGLHVRQAAGITAFGYSFLHLVFFCIDKGWLETFKELSSILGLVATLVMMVLAITSSRKAIKMLRRNWKKIHRLAYFAGITAVLHVALLKHGDWIPYLIILMVGFLLRSTFVRERVALARLKLRMAVPE